MLWQIQLRCTLFGLNPSPPSPHWRGSHALLFAYPIITYYLVLASLPCWSASKIVKHYVSQFPFVKHHVDSPRAASASDVVFSKYTNCLENDLWFWYNTKWDGQESSLLSLSSSRFRCCRIGYRKPLHLWSHPLHSFFHWWQTYFWKGRTEHADITKHSKPYRIFAPLFLPWGYDCEIFFRGLCLIECWCLSPDSVALNYSRRLQNVCFLSSKKS